MKEKLNLDKKLQAMLELLDEKDDPQTWTGTLLFRKQHFKVELIVMPEEVNDDE